MLNMRELTTAGVVPVGLLATQALLHPVQPEPPMVQILSGSALSFPSAAAHLPKMVPFSAPLLIEKLDLGKHLAPQREAALYQEIDVYRGLLEDWDGYGAAAPSMKALSDMESFIRMMPPGLAIPTCTLASSGLPSLYWDERDFFADLEFHGDGGCSLYARAKRDSSVDKIFLELDSPGAAAANIINELDRLGV